jgi:hypothetical protein
MEVLNQLRPGLDEKLYERAIIIGLRRCGRILGSPFVMSSEVETSLND